MRLLYVGTAHQASMGKQNLHTSAYHNCFGHLDQPVLDRHSWVYGFGKERRYVMKVVPCDKWCVKVLVGQVYGHHWRRTSFCVRDEPGPRSPLLFAIWAPLTEREQKHRSAQILFLQIADGHSVPKVINALHCRKVLANAQLITVELRIYGVPQGFVGDQQMGVDHNSQHQQEG